MASSVLREPEALAQKVRVTADELVVKLVDGRTVSVPVQWYPRLAHGSPAERQNWQIIGRGVGVHWPDRGGLCPPQTADKAMNTDGASVPRRCVMESDLHLASIQKRQFVAADARQPSNAVGVSNCSADLLGGSPSS